MLRILGKAIALLVALLSIGGHILGQNTSGLTGVPDTSFSNVSEWTKLVGRYPYIGLVSDTPDVSRERHGLVYLQRERRELLLDVFYPINVGDTVCPAILIVHGGGWRSGNRKQHHPLARKLSESGFVCFTADYRLSTEARYPAAVHDLKAVVKWIREHAADHDVDGSRIAVAGFSAGGQLAALLGTTNHQPEFEDIADMPVASSEVQAIVNIDGILSFVHPAAQEGKAATQWFGFARDENQAIWEEASPLSHVGINTPPTLFINSAVERMHAGRDDFRAILSRHGIYTHCVAFEDAPHSFCLFHPWFEPTARHISAFLKDVL